MANMGHAQWRLVNAEDTQAFLQPLKCAEGQPVWYPLIPLGDFEYTDPQTEETFRFSVTQQYLDEMVAHLKGGDYGGHGIPIDEDNFHQTLEDGSDAWVKDLDIRDGGLWGLVEPTKKGVAALESRPYISPKFTIGDGVDPKYQLRNFIRSGALVSKPWFWPQPGMEAVTIAASMSTLDRPAAPVADNAIDVAGTVAGAESIDEGGSTMTPEEIAALQEELAEAKTALETQAAALETLTAEKTALETSLAERDEQITALTTRAEAAETEQASLSERLAKIEETLALANQEAAIEAKINELGSQIATETIVLENGETVMEERVPSKEYREIAASAFVKGDAESYQALNVFLAKHNHRVPTESAGSKPALKPIAASASTAGPETEADKLAAWKATKVRKSAVSRLMSTQNMPFEEAKRQVLATGV